MSDQNERYIAGSKYRSIVWQELVTSALLGTDRRGVTVRRGSDELGQVLARLDGEDAQKQLLGAAAVVTAYNRAGRLPEVAATVLEQPCDADDTPCCSHRAAQHLATMRNGQFQELLGEWLRVAALAGKRVPEESLPTLLDLGQANASFREPIKAVLGKRGWWLAAQRNDWKSTYMALPLEGDNSTWETGDRDTRVMALSLLRVAEPARARELVMESWAREPADARAAFVGAFASNLSMDDEPFLESALDDKSKQVREVAAELLATLPDSRLVARMEERVKPLIKILGQRNLLVARSIKISVTLPEQVDKSALRDGIGTKTQGGQGQKAEWLIEMLSCVPPSIWCKQSGRTPEEIVKAALDNEWKETLLKGWITATKNFKDVAWAEALLARGPLNIKGTDAAPLLTVLPPKRSESLVLEIMLTKKSVMETKELTWRMLWQLPTPWSMEVSKAVLLATEEYIAATANKGDWEMRGSIIYFARAISPRTLEEAINAIGRLDTGHSFYSDSLDKFTAIAHFRHEMLRELGA